MKRLDVLAIGAHPDDVELSCAGTLIKLVKQGRSVGILDLTEGELGTRGSREIRIKEAEKAAEIMGIQPRLNLHLKDGDIKPDQENIIKLMEVIRTYSPDLLLFPYSVDRHPDHEHAHRLCTEAWFYSGLAKIMTAVGGQPQEPHRPRKYLNYMQWHEFTPSIIVNITDEFPEKMMAIQAYASQFHNPDSVEPQTLLSDPEFFAFLETRASYYGSKIGTKYGEPFWTPSIPGIDDLYTLI